MILIEDRKNIYNQFESYETLNIKGVLYNTDYECLLDDLDNPKTIWCKDNYFNFLYAKNIEGVKAFEEANTASYYGFAGTNDLVYKYFLERELIHWQNTCDQYHYAGKKFEYLYPLESLVAEDAVYVNDFYEYKNDESLEKIRDAIVNRPSSCIRKEGVLVSYVMLHDDDSIGYMYTLKEYRNKGYAYQLTKDIVNKTLLSGRLPYIQIVQINEKSKQLALKAGFVKHGEVHWFGVVHIDASFDDDFKHYQSLYNTPAKAVTSKTMLRLKYKPLTVEVTETDFIYEGTAYAYTCNYDNEIYFIYSDMPEDVLISGLYKLIKEDSDMIICNADIKSTCFRTV